MHGDSRNPATANQPESQPPQPQPYYFTHEFGGSSQLSTTLVHALADVAGVDVTQAEFRLADYVDPDALNQLFAPSGDGTAQVDGHLSFTVWGNQVTIYNDGQIVIAPPVEPQSV